MCLNSSFFWDRVGGMGVGDMGEKERVLEEVKGKTRLKGRGGVKSIVSLKT